MAKHRSPAEHKCVFLRGPRTTRRAALCVLLAACAINAVASQADIVRVGAGGYLAAPPKDAKRPPERIYRTEDFRGPMPTNDWWSSLAWVPLSDAMYPHPLAVRAVDGGLRVYYPGPKITANNAAIFGFMPGGGDDLVLGHSKVAKFPEARVAAASDWFVTAQFGDAAAGMRVAFGHGSPFVFARFAGGEPVMSFARAPELLAGSANDAALALRVDGHIYGLFAPSGSTWSDLGTAKLAAHTGGKDYFALALMPDARAETFALFRRHAFAHVTDTRVAWSYDEKKGTVHTTFTYTTRACEGTEKDTLFALYPHQWRHTRTALTGLAYASVRGPMRLGSGNRFELELPLPGMLPSLPLAASCDRARLRELIAAELRAKPRLVGDTYWLGKALGKWATLLPLAEQAEDAAAAAECDTRIRKALENFFTPADEAGAPKNAGAGVFAYDKAWGTLIGYPASFGSDGELNDHHFHYGYFVRAAAELARRDRAWADSSRFGGMVRLLIRDIACPDRNDALFPFLRSFDPYAGHSWASGHAKFGDGNNNESSSEAVNAWFGILMFGEATGDRELRDLGAWLCATEVAAIEDYWFDVHGDLFPRDYPPSVVTMVWGGKGANGTWFSANPEAVHGINFLPMTGASLYLGRYPEYVRENYDALVRENLADDAKKAAAHGAPAPTDGTRWDQWAELIWMYRALDDAADARAQFDARPADFAPEAGNSLANTYAWITALETFGRVDRTVGADAPCAVVFEKTGKHTHVAWNLGDTPRTVTFSDGATLACPPRGVAVK